MVGGERRGVGREEAFYPQLPSNPNTVYVVTAVRCPPYTCTRCLIFNQALAPRGGRRRGRLMRFVVKVSRVGEDSMNVVMIHD